VLPRKMQLCKLSEINCAIFVKEFVGSDGEYFNGTMRFMGSKDAGGRWFT
jgi:hypothetical protein